MPPQHVTIVIGVLLVCFASAIASHADEGLGCDSLSLLQQKATALHGNPVELIYTHPSQIPAGSPQGDYKAEDGTHGVRDFYVDVKGNETGHHGMTHTDGMWATNHAEQTVGSMPALKGSSKRQGPPYYWEYDWKINQKAKYNRVKMPSYSASSCKREKLLVTSLKEGSTPGIFVKVEAGYEYSFFVRAGCYDEYETVSTECKKHPPNMYMWVTCGYGFPSNTTMLEPLSENRVPGRKPRNHFQLYKQFKVWRACGDSKVGLLFHKPRVDDEIYLDDSLLKRRAISSGENAGMEKHESDSDNAGWTAVFSSCG